MPSYSKQSNYQSAIYFMLACHSIGSYFFFYTDIEIVFSLVKRKIFSIYSYPNQNPRHCA
ncbi:hypothetical protein BFC17_04810 [Alteromonas lipolytica]|uniref:Uncharacterized protein n=1 Tax=Alteromonas lipolytica TaxID=1856405 RepID=A0A1E8F9B6_9ALTE|nr:hypothetical protein BFC17_04810 [Alteromonas lipolytica]